MARKARHRRGLLPSQRTRKVVTPLTDRRVYSFTCHKCESNIECGSDPELYTCIILAADNRVMRFYEQPQPMYWVDETGKTRRHTPDFEVTYTDNKVNVYEVKPAARARAYEERTQQAIEHYASLNKTYQILDERFWSRQPLLANSFNLWRQGIKHVHPGLPLALASIFEYQNPKTLRELELAADKHIESRDDLLHMAVNGYFTLDLESELISGDTRILSSTAFPLRRDGTSSAGT